MRKPRDRDAATRVVPGVGRKITIQTRTNDTVTGTVTFSSPDKFCVTNPSGHFWVYSDGWRVLADHDLIDRANAAR